MSSFVSGIREGNTTLLLRITTIAAIGGLLFGFDTGVIGGAILYIKTDLHAGSFAQEAIVSSLLLGAIVGAIISGWAADAMSRKWTKVGSGTLYFLAAIGCALSMNVPMLVGFRFLLGVSVGTASFVSPMYISEVSPPKVRGGLTSFNQLAVTTGIAIAYLVNFAFKGLPGNWRWMLGVAAIPGALLAGGMLTVPHTPRWLLERGRRDEARDVLIDLRHNNDRQDDNTAEGDPQTTKAVDQELGEIAASADEAHKGKLRDLLASRYRPLLVVGIGLALFQQFVGINTVIYYAPTILSDTGLSNGGAIARTVAIGLTNVAFTVLAVLLLDKVGRRKLLIGGTIGLTVALALLGTYFASGTLQQHAPYLALVALELYIASFAVGLGPVFWLMISEIYPLRIRSHAMSASTVANWGGNFLVAATFLTLTGVITREGTFFLYTLVAIGAVFFFARKVPETAGRSLEQIERDLLPEGAGEQAGREAARSS